MSRMNKIKMWVILSVARLPEPVALFILGRVLRPLSLIVVSLFMAVVFSVFMLIIAIIAPFSPKGAHQIFDHIMGSLGK